MPKEGAGQGAIALIPRHRCIYSIREIGTRPMVGLQGCFDEAGADFGFGRGVY